MPSGALQACIRAGVLAVVDIGGLLEFAKHTGGEKKAGPAGVLDVGVPDEKVFRVLRRGGRGSGFSCAAAPREQNPISEPLLQS